MPFTKKFEDWARVPAQSHLVILFFFNTCSFIYLAAPSLGCYMWVFSLYRGIRGLWLQQVDLFSFQLWHVDS